MTTPPNTHPDEITKKMTASKRAGFVSGVFAVGFFEMFVFLVWALNHPDEADVKSLYDAASIGVFLIICFAMFIGVLALGLGSEKDGTP